jgi:hypothetical protein
MIKLILLIQLKISICERVVRNLSFEKSDRTLISYQDLVRL